MAWSVRSDQNGSTLAHYGVKGMRWGVRKEYEPKGRKTKTNKQTQVLNSDGDPHKLSKEIKDTIYNFGPEYRREHAIITTKTDKADVITDYTTPAELKTDRDGVYEEHALKTNPVKYATAEEAQKKFENLPKTDDVSRLSDREISLKVNHGNALTEARRHNCYECTLAYEARRRGYDVQANECPGGRTMDIFHAFDVVDKINVRIRPSDGMNLSNEEKAEMCYSQIEKTCLSYGEGARGMLGIQYADYNSGHAMTWLVENGEFKIIDPQNGGRDGKNTFLKCDAELGVDVCRLDNADMLPGITDYVDPWEVDQDIVNKVKIGQHVSQLKLVTKTDIENPVDKYRREQKKKSRAAMGKTAVGRAMLKIGDTAVKAAKTVKEYVKKGAETVSKVLKNFLTYRQKTIKHADPHRTWDVVKSARRNHDDYVQRR